MSDFARNHGLSFDRLNHWAQKFHQDQIKRHTEKPSFMPVARMMSMASLAVAFGFWEMTGFWPMSSWINTGMGCRFIVKLIVLSDWAWIFAAETLTGWVAKAVEALEPIASALQAQAFEAFVLHVDATGLLVLDHKHPNNIKRGTYWCMWVITAWFSLNSCRIRKEVASRRFSTVGGVIYALMRRGYIQNKMPGLSIPSREPTWWPSAQPTRKHLVRSK
jgi:hypothetical protein